QIVTEKLIQPQHSLFDFSQNLFRRVPLRLVAQMKRVPWLVRHDPDVALINRIAAEIHVEFNFLLQHHHELSGVIVSAEELLAVMQPVNVLPPAAAERFKECRPADVMENRFPIERVTEVAK